MSETKKTYSKALRKNKLIIEIHFLHVGPNGISTKLVIVQWGNLQLRFASPDLLSDLFFLSFSAVDLINQQLGWTKHFFLKSKSF